MQIAKEIHRQLFALTPRPILWSWGTHAMQGMTSKTLESIKFDFQDEPLYGRGAIKFMVSGKIFGGHVLIVLNGADLYDIYLGRIARGTMKVKHVINGVYAEDLGNTLDMNIENKEGFCY